jgi:hypothetical protein
VRGDRLGALGSIIVAEVLSNAMSKPTNLGEEHAQTVKEIIANHQFDWKSMFAFLDFMKLKILFRGIYEW